MLNLYGDILKLLLEESSDSEAKYAADIQTIKKVADTVDKNQDKFKKEFIKYFYEQNGVKDTNNSDNSSQENYQKSGCEEVAWFFMYYINKLLGVSNSEASTRTLKLSNDYLVKIESGFNLPFTYFDTNASIRVVPDRSNKPGKRFSFDVDLDESSFTVFPTETNDSNFKIPDESVDILQYRDYEYKDKKKKDLAQKYLDTIKSKYNNSDMQRYIMMAYSKAKEKLGKVDSKSNVEKLNKTVLQVVAKKIGLKIEKSEIKNSESWKYIDSSIYTNLGSLHVSSYFGGDFSNLDSVTFYSSGDSDDKVVLYDTNKNN